MDTLSPANNRKSRRFIPDDFRITDWNSLKQYFDFLSDFDLGSVNELRDWLSKRSELETICEEDFRWRFIKTTLDTQKKENREAYNEYIVNIQPHISNYQQLLDKKFIACPFIENLDPASFSPYIKRIKNRIALFTEENIPLNTDLKILERKYEELISGLSVEWNANSITLQSASRYLKSPDRNTREKAYRKISAARMEVKNELDELYDKLVSYRHKVALNAAYSNYRDYRFAELARFDYNAGDCQHFHEAVLNDVMPLVDELYERKMENLGVSALRPWDLKASTKGEKRLQPFANTREMVDRAIRCFNDVDPYFADCLSLLDEMNYLDLDSRMGKAPGGYNCGLPEKGIPFIFMNATGSPRDVKVMMHEGGHAVHTFLSRDLELNGFKEITSEIAELAAMSMELLTFDRWHHFYEDKNDLTRARIEQLENIVMLFPWVAAIDKFQHWVYLNPNSGIKKRSETWYDIFSQYSTKHVNWDGMEEYKFSQWQRQLHLFKVPFYYIEYAIAQLGAISLWKDYRRDPEMSLKRYKETLSLGYTRSIKDTYNTAGIPFEFTSGYIRGLLSFLMEEIDELYLQLK